MPATHIHVARDPQGLQLALRSLLEEQLARHQMRAAFERAEEMDDQATLDRLDRELPREEIAEGYFKRAGYLMELASTIQVGVPVDAASVTHLDVDGLKLVRTVRAEFEREHPACPRCGERQPGAMMPRCYSCNHELRSTGGR